MPKSIQTSGDMGIDREFDALWSAVGTASSAATGTTTVNQTITSAAAPAPGLTVQNASGSVSYSTSTLALDDTGSDLGVTPMATGAIQIARTAQTAVTPAAIGSTADPGSSTHAANADHVHALDVGLVIVLCAGFTPAGTGGDVAEFTLPYSAADGTTTVTWNVRRIDFRVQTAGGAPAVTVEKYTGTGAFSATAVGSVTLGSGANEGSQTSGFTTSTLSSGDKVRFNPTALGTATNWTVQLELG